MERMAEHDVAYSHHDGTFRFESTASRSRHRRRVQVLRRLGAREDVPNPGQMMLDISLSTSCCAPRGLPGGGRVHWMFSIIVMLSRGLNARIGIDSHQRATVTPSQVEEMSQRHNVTTSQCHSVTAAKPHARRNGWLGGFRRHRHHFHSPSSIQGLPENS
jgi:hypothetical protein